MLTQSHLRRAFSLLELIVVLAVLAIIAAVIWPVFERSRENATKSSCPNNLKQISLGFKQYLNDFKGNYPLIAVTNTSGLTPPYGWADALDPYIKNFQVFQCPSDTNWGVETPNTANYTDYWYNANFIIKKKTKSGATIWTGANEAMLGSSAQTILAGDGGNTNRTPTGDARYNQCGNGSSLSGGQQTCSVSPEGQAIYPAAKIHFDGANFAFADGHVKWLRGNHSTQTAPVMNNGATQKTIGGKFTFSLLTK